MTTTSVQETPETTRPDGFKAWDNYGYGFHVGETRPTDYDVVEVWNSITCTRYMLNPRDMAPWQNIACLYWRPVKKLGEEIH